MERVAKAWNDFKTKPREFFDLGDEDLVLAEIHGRRKKSGMPIEATMMGAALFSLRDGKVVRLGSYTDPAAALKAAGLSE
mgnify:CR=1 FL=1